VHYIVRIDTKLSWFKWMFIDVHTTMLKASENKNIKNWVVAWKYGILSVYYCTCRPRRLQDPTADFSATVCKQFASTIFADLPLRIRIGRLQSGTHLVSPQQVAVDLFSIYEHQVKWPFVGWFLVQVAFCQSQSVNNQHFLLKDCDKSTSHIKREKSKYTLC